MNVFKKFSLAYGLSSLLLVSACAQANPLAGQQLGVMFGSDDGLALKVDDLHIGIGLNRFSLSVDKVYPMQEHPELYYGLGAKYLAGQGHKQHRASSLGLRGVIGAQTQIEQFNFFIEARPTLYVLGRSRLELEAVGGVRLQF